MSYAARQAWLATLPVGACASCGARLEGRRRRLCGEDECRRLYHRAYGRARFKDLGTRNHQAKGVR